VGTILAFIGGFLMKILKSRLWWPVALAGLILLLLLLARSKLSSPQGLKFSNVQELKVWAEGRGFHCQSDREDGRMTTALAVSTHPLTWEQVGHLCRSTPGERDEWKEVIWAINLPSDWEAAPVLPWAGECRLWGGILVTGDRHLLDRLETPSGDTAARRALTPVTTPGLGRE
jgi:hypothetical protein